MKNSNFKKMKILLLIVASIIFIGLILSLIPLMKDIATYEGRIKFKEQISEYGIFSGIILLLLQIAQILLVILPGEPLEVLAGMFYGSIGGTIFIFASVFITTIVIVLLVKKYGKRLLYEFFKREKIDKILESKIFKNTRRVEIVMTILFILPGTPKDLLVYLGGLLPISTFKFIIISTFARFPSVISSTIAGDSITDGRFGITVLAYAISFIFTFIVIIFINKFDKNNITKEAIESVK